MHHRSSPQLQPQTPLEGRLPRDCSRSILISQTPWSIMHPSAWKGNSPKFVHKEGWGLYQQVRDFGPVDARLVRDALVTVLPPPAPHAPRPGAPPPPAPEALEPRLRRRTRLV